jgi:hypothetical protein
MSWKMMSIILILLFTCLAFSVSVSFDFPCTAHALFPERLSYHYHSLYHKKIIDLPLSDPSRNRIKPDTRLQMKGRKSQHVHPTA